MKRANYDRFPCVAVPGGERSCVQGWDAIAARLRRAVAERGQQRTVLAIECYGGVDEPQILDELRARLDPALVLHAADAMWPAAKIDRLVEPFLGGDDPLFGWLSGLTLPQFFDPAAVAGLRRQAQDVAEGLVLVVGCGAASGGRCRRAGLCRSGPLGGPEPLPPRRGEQSRGDRSNALRGTAIQTGILRRLAGVRSLETPADLEMGFPAR